MSGLTPKKLRNPTFFEKMLLAVGIAVALLGFWLINRLHHQEPILTWNLVIAVFLWLQLIFIIILTDSNESIKEELGIIIKEHIEETKLMKKELRVLSKAFDKKKK